MLFSAMLRYTFIPKNFMNVIMVPIIKNKCGDPCSKDNYRPISLASIISKVFERILLLRCENFLLVSDNQFAYSKNLSTELCIYTMKQIIFSYNKCNTPIYACFIDIRKAFDRIDNDKLIMVLKSLYVPDFILNILIYWFLNQRFYLKWQSHLSNPFYSTCGLRQGSVLSPILFNIYLDCLSKKLNATKLGCYMGEYLINHFCYADDTALIAPSFKCLQYLVNICEEFGKEYNVIFNIVKTKFMIFKPKFFKDVNPSLFFNNEKVEAVDSFCYLGVNISKDLKDDQEMKVQIRNICARSNSLIRKFNFCSTRIKADLFRTYCTCIYGIGLWCNFYQNTIKSMKVSYNNAFRYLLGLDRYCSISEAFLNNGVTSFQEMIRNRQFKLQRLVINSRNTLVMASAKYAADTDLLEHWRKSLFV